ncbi:hypothetical protein [Nocardia panacis]|uniref:hypothetical protein n=1 Tax=Nocardia panacis TaxID=2340916 RepID=UPI00193A74B5|nr:hypothetical protein [Nocardia panacis]
MAITFDIAADLEPFSPGLDKAKVALMVADAVATAGVVAPCLRDMAVTAPEYPAAKALIRGAILRWLDTGSGAAVQVSAGPYSQTLDTRQQRRSMFWPLEISDLQKLCRARRASAFTIDMTPVYPDRPMDLSGVRVVNGPDDCDNFAGFDY